jgi:uncharacterized membrane protein YdjX (TVP38/TMEM64 family)
MVSHASDEGGMKMSESTAQAGNGEVLTARARRWAGPAKWISAAIIVIALFAIISVLPVQEGLLALESWIRRFGAVGMLVYALIYAVAVVLLVPGSPLTIAAGAIFGPLWGGWGLLFGTLTVMLGSNAGAAAALLIARYLARDRVAGWAARNPKFQAVDRAVAEGGWQIVALLRLSPAVPFNLQNYLYGLTPIRFWTCVLTSLVAMIPGTFLYVYLGYLGRVSAEAAAGAESASIGKWVLLGVGLLATLAVTILITRKARQVLERQTEIDEAETDASKAKAGEQPSAERERPAGWPWGATAAVAAALILVVLASVARANATAIQNWITGLFGPPAVTMAEVYEPKPDGPTFDHALFDEVLEAHVKPGGWVDYPALKQDRDKLDRYVASLADAPFDRLGRNEKLALLINAYNAFALQLVIDHYPIEKIWDIGEPFSRPTVEIGGRKWTLNQIEHEQIRPKFKEPRIHFAVVCAAYSCPPLRREAYVGDRIDAQLEDQTVYCHNHPRWFRFEAGASVVHLTELYNWYGGDFEQAAGSVLEYAARYSQPLERALEAGEPPTIEWINYQWRLNSVEN